MPDQTTYEQPEPGDDDDARQQVIEEALRAKLMALIEDRRNKALRNADADAEGRTTETAVQADVSALGSRNTRRRILKTADGLVNGDRNVQYGDPKADFARTAAYWQTYLHGIVEREQGTLVLKPHDVAVMQMLLKVSRLSWTPAKEDHWVDVSGYAACGADCAEATYGGLQ